MTSSRITRSSTGNPIHSLRSSARKADISHHGDQYAATLAQVAHLRREYDNLIRTAEAHLDAAQDKRDALHLNGGQTTAVLATIACGIATIGMLAAAPFLPPLWPFVGAAALLTLACGFAGRHNGAWSQAERIRVAARQVQLESDALDKVRRADSQMCAPAPQHPAPKPPLSPPPPQQQRTSFKDARAAGAFLRSASRPLWDIPESDEAKSDDTNDIVQQSSEPPSRHANDEVPGIEVVEEPVNRSSAVSKAGESRHLYETLRKSGGLDDFFRITKDEDMKATVRKAALTAQVVEAPVKLVKTDESTSSASRLCGLGRQIDAMMRLQSALSEELAQESQRLRQLRSNLEESLPVGSDADAGSGLGPGSQPVADPGPAPSSEPTAARGGGGSHDLSRYIPSKSELSRLIRG